MKSFLKKFKKTKLSTRLVYLFVLIIFIISYILLLINVLKLTGIETKIRIIALVIIGILLFIYSFNGLLLLMSKHNKSVIFMSFIALLLSSVSIIISLAINRAFNAIDNLSKDMITYTSDLIALKGTELENTNDFKVGMINNETDVEGNVLAYEMIKNENYKFKIEKYDSYFEILEKLYNKEINAMFISSNYITIYSTYDKYKNIENETEVLKSYSKEMKNQDYIENSASVTDPFTILLMGVDSPAQTLKANAAFNGDTLMMISFNPHTLDATIFSIPRDTYVPIACLKGASSKINSSAAYGTQCVINTIQNLTDINIDYYLKVDFKAVIDLVNAVGGIDITVPKGVNFCESNQYRSLAKKDLICINEGEQKMNGEQALAFARHRKTLPAGDFQRVQHQQLIVEALANKIKDIRSVNEFYSILDAISPNMDTNMQTKDILSLYGVAKKAITSSNNSQINVNKTYLTGYDLTMYVPNLGGNVYTFQYYPQSLDEIKDAMKITLEKKKAQLIKTFNFSINEPYEESIIGKKYYTVQRNETIPNFTGQTEEYVKAWCEERNITVYVDYQESPENPEGVIINQSVRRGMLTKDTKNITITVSKTKKDLTTTTTTDILKSSTTSDSTSSKTTKDIDNTSSTTTTSTKQKDETTSVTTEAKNETTQ